jgi:hypothetical protein
VPELVHQTHLTREQCCRPMKFWYGSGSADLYKDPDSEQDLGADPDILVSDLQDVNKKLVLNFLCLLLFEGTFTSFFKDKK